MKIVLINPHRHMMGKHNIWKKIDTKLPALGLGYITSYLEQQGHQVQIIDLVAEPYKYYALDKLVSDADFVGITASTVTITGALKIAGNVKQINPFTKIVIGGSHCTAVPEEVLNNPNVDFVVRGEGELVFADLVENHKTAEKVKGISFKNNGKIIHNPQGEFIQNLDDLPYPAHHLMPIDKYKPSLGNYKRLPAMSVLCGRGCPGRCTFCYSEPFGRKIRFRSVDNIIGELKVLTEKYKIKEISFYDENFTTNRFLIRDLCKEMLKERLDLTWTCSSRVDTVDEITLKDMADAGCHQIAYGVESADEQILKNIKKNIKITDAISAVRMTQEAGIDARANFMIGCPGETKETMQATFDFAKILDVDLVVFNICTPLPGTEMFRWAKEKGYLKTLDYQDYDFSRHVMNLPTISSEEVEEFYKTSHKRFYIRKGYLWNRLKKIKSPTQLAASLRAFNSLRKGG